MYLPMHTHVYTIPINAHQYNYIIYQVDINWTLLNGRSVVVIQTCLGCGYFNIETVAYSVDDLKSINNNNKA